MAQIVTITNPLTGQPAQVDQLEHTAQQIDDAIARALPGGAIDTALQKKADSSSVYTKSESISAETRTALSLAETATPDAALAEIARQLSESGGISMDNLWENASPTSSFEPQTIVEDLSNYWGVMIVFFRDTSNSSHSVYFIKKNSGYRPLNFMGSSSLQEREATASDDGITFGKGATTAYNGSWSTSNSLCIPYQIYGLRGIA